MSRTSSNENEENDMARDMEKDKKYTQKPEKPPAAESYAPPAEAPPTRDPQGYEVLRAEKSHRDGGDEPAVVIVEAVYDPSGCGDAAVRLECVEIDFFAHGRKLGCAATDNRGVAHHEVPPGPVSLLAQSLVHLQGGKRLRCSLREPLYLHLAPCERRRVTMTYHDVLGEIQVTAVLADPEAPGTSPLSDVGLALFQDNKPVGSQQWTRPDGAPVVFPDLGNGIYKLRITSPAGPVALSDPPRSEVPLQIQGSQPMKLRICFGPAFGTVTALVYAKAGRGLPGIVARLIATDTSVWSTTSAADGMLTFGKVPPGPCTLELVGSKFLTPDGQSWELPEGASGQQTVVAMQGQVTSGTPFLLEQEVHGIHVTVVDEHQQALPRAVVRVTDLNHNPIGAGNYLADEQGEVTVYVEESGFYLVGLADRGEEVVQVNSMAHKKLTAKTAGTKTSPPPSQPSESTIDIPYPLLTESAPMSGSSSWSTPPAAADLGQTVESTLRSVLNWRSAGFNGDAKGFLAALNQSFTVKQIEGHTEVTWTPRSYAVQTGLGALTGAQASIYTRAKAAFDQAGPLLAGLYALSPTADPQDVEAIRAIVLSSLTELVNELGIEGGPRVLRADDLFQQLLGPDGETDPEHVKGHLGRLSRIFGLERKWVNTIDQEQNLTNYLILVDYVLGLRMSWTTQRRFFTRGAGADPFLGTQLVLVERSLAVVAQSVQDAYAAMDSVYVGKEERQVVELQYPNQPSLFVAELLSWIDQVASTEGPQLIRDGGKMGVLSFGPTIGNLAFLAAGALIPPQTAAAMPPGYRTARVQRALQELAEHLDETSRLVNQILPA